MDNLTRSALAVNYANLALGHQRLTVPHATLVRDPALPLIYDANFVTDVTAATPDEIDSLLAAVDAAYPHTRARTYRLLPDTPPAVEARLALDGYERSDSLVMLLEGALHDAPKPCDIRLAATGDDWRAYASLKRADFMEHGAALEPDVAEQVAAGLAVANRAKCPPSRYWLAWADGAPRGFFNAWEGIGGVGQVEDLYVDPAYRHRGIATALIHHCVADARAHGADPVVIVCDPGDTPKNMYAGLGFRPIAVARLYRRTAL
ncbi:MAG TPA: GNAT family N-acetyltransferase [Dehalococcoidia bacterium]|nr:GNAT family N-acetyltransferase [Dehalococcoidia bacterium]